MTQQHSIRPQVLVQPIDHTPGPAAGAWRIAWRIQNLGQQPLQLLAARAPHARFRGQEREFAPPPTLLPGESADIELAVACSEPPGTVVENAFLILRVRWGDEPWSILVRLRVVVDQAGTVRTLCEDITTQPIGFSCPGG